MYQQIFHRIKLFSPKFISLAQFIDLAVKFPYKIDYFCIYSPYYVRYLSETGFCTYCSAQYD